MKENNKFEYSYSGSSQEEVRKIRQKYIADEQEDKMTKLRKLDASVTKKAMIISLILGIAGALVMGVGMSFTMVWQNYIIGIPVGILGLIATAIAYPVYIHIVKKQKKKIAPEILRLSDELLKR